MPPVWTSGGRRVKFKVKRLSTTDVYMKRIHPRDMYMNILPCISNITSKIKVCERPADRQTYRLTDLIKYTLIVRSEGLEGIIK